MTVAPDFIVAGAMRAGTTALAAALAEHPAVFMCSPKEPNYFAVQRGALDFRGPGDQGFARENVADWAAYQDLFAAAGTRARGEASAMYLTLPGVASAIHRRRPDVRVVLILRDPVERAYSAWQYQRSKGREPLHDVRDGLAAEERRRREGYGPMWWYVGAGRYQHGLQEYLETFPAEQLHVLTTEALRADAAGAMSGVYAFLGLDGAGFSPSVLAGEVNASGVPRLDLLTRVLWAPQRLRAPLSRVAPPAVRQLVRRARAASLDRTGELPPDVRGSLREQLADVAPAVARLTGLDTTGWQVPAG
ncbi:sulfotransferase [Blastococcus sp. SYSU D00695]